MKRKTSTCAIAGFILSFFIFTPGLILSIVGLDETKKYGEDGKGLAIAGIVISCITLLVTIVIYFLLMTIVIFFFVAMFFGFFLVMPSIYEDLDIPEETSMEDKVCSYGDYYYTGRYGQDGYISCGPTSYSGYYVCEYVDEYGDLEEVTCRNYEY